MEHYQAVSPSLKPTTTADLFRDYMESKEKTGLKKSSLQIIKSIVGRFADENASILMREITTSMVEHWLDCAGFDNPVTRNNAIRYLRGFFIYAFKRGYLLTNPMNPIEWVKVTPTMPEYVPYEGVKAVLSRADEKIIPRLVLGFFAGIRSSELDALKWKDILWDAGLILIRPEVAKVRQARHIDIELNLKQWLREYGPATGPISPTEKVTRRLISEAVGDTKWPRNALRHTYATMHLAYHEDAAKTALQLGHKGTDILFRHYRGLATKADAEQFWGLTPEIRPEPTPHKEKNDVTR
jgi:integrase